MEENKESKFRKEQKVETTNSYQPKNYLQNYTYTEKAKRHDYIMSTQKPTSDCLGHDM